MCVCVCVCVCARACVRACVCVCVCEGGHARMRARAVYMGHVLQVHVSTHSIVIHCIGWRSSIP